MPIEHCNYNRLTSSILQTVQCDNQGYNKDTRKYNWVCDAGISDRVKINHADVICEGYDYPEDDYILLGSCGLEFTLDYSDPHDHHENSYFKHMDDHEKQLHREKTRSMSPPKKSDNYLQFIEKILKDPTQHAVTVALTAVACIAFLILIVKFRPRRVASCSQISSVVLATKKTC